MALLEQIAKEALTDIRGWSLRSNVDFTRVGSGGDFHLILASILASPEQVDAASPACTRMWSCRVGDDVLIKDERWREGAAAWTRSLRDYRSYVINHEVGHWLGLGHARCPGKGKSAPVMMQQSKGLEGCTARVWPKFRERNAVASGRNVKGWPTPATAVQQGDEPRGFERMLDRRPVTPPPGHARGAYPEVTPARMD